VLGGKEMNKAKVKVKKEKVKSELEKIIHAFEMTQKLKEELRQEGIPIPKRPEEELNFDRLDELVGGKSSDIGDLMVYFTRWHVYSESMEGWAAAELAMAEKCAEFCKSQLILIMPKDLKEIMLARVESHSVMKKYSRRLLRAKTRHEIYKKMSKSLLRSVETVSREMTRRDSF
jgi:hypothetical protein